MPPIHPAIVHYPIALGVVSVLAETAALVFGVPSLAPLAYWTIAIAALGAILAAGAGYWDMNRDELARETHELVHLHLKSGLILMIALIIAAAWRWSLSSPSFFYLLFAWAIVAGLAVQAWLGGEIVYSPGGGVAAANQGTASPEEAKRPSRRFYRWIKGRDLKSNGDDHAA